MRFGLSLVLLRPLAQVLARVGGDGARFLAELGIDADASADTYVDAAQVDRVLDAVATERGDPSLGLTLAKTAAMYPLGFFDHLVWPGATVREALSRSKRFYGLITTRSVLALEESATTISLRQTTPEGAPRGTVLTELAFGSVVLRARAAAGAFHVQEVRFVHSAPAEIAPYEEVFAAPVRFAQSVDALDFEPADLDRTLGTADPIAAAALEAEATRMTEARGHDDRFLDAVRAGIRRALGGQEQGLGAVARALAISERTLQRRLLEHGTTLRALVDEVRRDVATRRLREGASTIELAYALGYATPQAFHKAFLRWTGLTPGAFRSGK